MNIPQRVYDIILRYHTITIRVHDIILRYHTITIRVYDIILRYACQNNMQKIGSKLSLIHSYAREVRD